MADRSCRYCGAVLAGNLRTKCTALACRRAYNNERTARFNAKWKQEHGQRFGKRYDDARATCWWTCLACGKEHGSAGPRSRRFCGRACQVQHGHREARQRYAERQMARASKGTMGHSVWHAGACGSCGCLFVARARGDPPAFCSDICQKREQRRRRRAAGRGIKTTPGRKHAVFVRDGWRCHLCGKKVRRNVRVPHKLAPVIDHVIPLALCSAYGVDDGPANWRTAHFLCNSVKGAGTGPMGDQLLLFG